MAIAISVSPAVSKAEGNSGDTVFSYTFTLLEAPPTTFGFVDFEFNSGASTADASDFSNFSSSYEIDFAAGQTQQTLNILVKGDTAIEPNETFSYGFTNCGFSDPNSFPDLNIDSFANATISGTILNDDFPPNTPPVANLDSVSIAENTAINIPAATLLSNDSDPDNDPLKIIGVSNFSNGTAVLNNNGTPNNTADDYVTFTPSTGFTGNASFNYTISDGNGGTNTATVGVTVNAVNQAPTAVNLLSPTTSLPENTPTPAAIKLADISITDDGLGSNSLTLSGTDAGFFAIQNNALYLKAGTTLDYEKQAAYNVTVNVDDPTVGSTPDASTNYTLALTNVNEAPAATGESVSTSKNTGSPITSITVDLANNVSDPDANGLANATLAVTGTTNGTITSIDQDARLVTFTPTAGFSGTASFNYTITDAGGLTSNAATVTVDVGDILTTGNKDQNIQGNEGNDYISAGNGKDTIYGLGGNDTLLGNNGVDTIDGGAGDDVINGGNGADLLTGGSGKDTFVLSKSAGGDTITDFTAGTDLIGLSGGLSFTQLSISSSGSNTLIKLGSDTLATLTGVSSTLTANNFVTV
jgi:hypothetical protein